MLLLMKLEAVEHARFRALAQILVDKDKGQEVFDEYMKVAFPYMEASKDRGKKDAHRALEQWVKQGAFGVTPMQQPTMRSKLKTRMASRSSPPSRHEINSLYNKLDHTMPL